MDTDNNNSFPTSDQPAATGSKSQPEVSTQVDPVVPSQPGETPVALPQQPSEPTSDTAQEAIVPEPSVSSAGDTNPQPVAAPSTGIDSTAAPTSANPEGQPPSTDAAKPAAAASGTSKKLLLFAVVLLVVVVVAAIGLSLLSK